MVLGSISGSRLFFALVLLLSFFLLFSACIDLSGLTYKQICGDGICDEKEKETCYSDCEIIPVNQLLEQGDAFIDLAGSNELEGQTLSVRVDGFRQLEPLTPEVKLSLLDGSGKIIESKFFGEGIRVHEAFSIKDFIYVNEIKINEARNRYSVWFQFQKYSSAK